MKRERKTTNIKDRILKRTKIPKNHNECWLWCGPVNNAGYGLIRGQGGIPKMITVHRGMAQSLGMDIENNEIQHTCLTKNCVNPKHLVYGTAKDRVHRIIKKHGTYFCEPKVKYKTCEHCGKESHVVWFSRQHNECYPGMKTKYSNISRKQA